MQLPVNRWWRRLLPSLPAVLAVALLLTLLAQPWRTMMVVSDGDSFLWWRTGDWMIRQQAILRSDVFSHTRYGAPFITKEWLANVIFAAAANAWGLYGLALVAATLIAVSFGLLYRQLLREGNDLLAASAVVLLTVWTACGHWMARPHLFSFLLLLLAHAALRRHARDGRTGRLAVVLAVIALFWVNLHGGFMMLFFLLGAYGAGAALDRDWPRLRALTGVGALCAVASLANPNGWALHRHTLQFLSSEYLTGWVVEFASPDFHAPDACGLLAWLALMFLALAGRRPKLTAAEGIVVLVWTYFALFSRRNTAMLALVTAPIFAPVLSDWLRSHSGAFAARAAVINQGAGSGPVLFAIALLAAVHWPRPIAVDRKQWPVDAVEYVRANPKMFTGNLFNSYVWGSYLLQALPEHRVFIDSREDFYGEDLLREFSDTMALQGQLSVDVQGARFKEQDLRAMMEQRAKWLHTLEKYRIGWTLLPADHPLNQALALLPNWACVCRDDNNTAAIFVKLR